MTIYISLRLKRKRLYISYEVRNQFQHLLALEITDLKFITGPLSLEKKQIRWSDRRRFQVSLLGCKDFVWYSLTWICSRIGKEDAEYCSVCPRTEHLCTNTSLKFLPSASCAAKWSHCFCTSLCVLGHDNGSFRVVLGICCLTLHSKWRQAGDPLQKYHPVLC